MLCLEHFSVQTDSIIVKYVIIENVLNLVYSVHAALFAFLCIPSADTETLFKKIYIF